MFFENYTARQLYEAFWSWADDYFSIDWMAGDVGPVEAYREVVKDPKAARDPNRARLWEGPLENASGRIAFNNGTKIGAVRGAETTHICYDLNGTNIHAYPVTPDEAMTIMEPNRVFFIEALP